jgi:hypothetical protein
MSLLISCSHGKTKNFPTTVPDPSRAAGAYVIRNNNLFGWGFTLEVLLDDMVIANLRSGEYVFFNVEPGFHTIGAKESKVNTPFEEKKKYYFLISADTSQFGFEIIRISNEKGEAWLTRAKAVK